MHSKRNGDKMTINTKEPNTQSPKLVVAVSNIPYNTKKEKHHIISEHEAQGWTFKKDTDRRLCFYLIKEAMG